MSDADQPDGAGDLISVEVAYALPDKQSIMSLSVTPGTTALAAVAQSGIEKQFPGLQISDALRLGIFGQLVPATQVLQAGDRVEIYRPLIADPKLVRKERAARVRARREETASAVDDAAADEDG